MKLLIKCKSCNRYIEIKEKALTRSELEDKIGDYFTKSCDHCNQPNEYHVNDVEAVGTDEIKRVGRYAAILIAAGCFYFAKGDRAIIFLGLFIAGAIFIGSRRLADAQSNVDIFNSIYIKERRQESKT